MFWVADSPFPAAAPHKSSKYATFGTALAGDFAKTYGARAATASSQLIPDCLSTRFAGVAMSSRMSERWDSRLTYAACSMNPPFNWRWILKLKFSVYGALSASSSPFACSSAPLEIVCGKPPGGGVGNAERGGKL